jgi:pSer/pThr/pTyr-binding forkhead associated (FHA) protein
VIAWDGEVSGVHAELHRIGEEWTIVDDGLSKNGTFLNGRRIIGRQRLRDGDRIRVGQTIIRFTDAATAARDATRSATDARRVDQITQAQRQALVALCRPLLLEGAVATPASNKQVAEELRISEQAVKARLRQLFDLFGLDGLHQNEKRATLAHRAIQDGFASPRDL